MEARGESQGGRRPIVFCIVPHRLARKLHEQLRRHFRDEPGVEVVVERRSGDRRCAPERRAGAPDRAAHRAELRRIRNAEGRRIGERRAASVPAQTASLPRRAQAYAEQIVFLERLEPSNQQLEDIDTARLITRIQAGDDGDFNVLYTRYFDRVFSYLRVIYNDVHAAEDSTQQVFTKVFEGLPRYERRPGKLFRAWLFVIARNEARRELEKRSHSDSMDPVALSADRERHETGEVDVSALEWVTDRDLVFLVERLPLPQRQVLMLRYMLDLQSPEIAAILGRSSEDVRILQHRALRFLEQRLTALGRLPRSRQRAPMGRWRKQYVVLRARRFSLSP